ncbi:MAG: hypothetical protein ACLFVE_09745 [Chitinispirillaceae bacterium]
MRSKLLLFTSGLMLLFCGQKLDNPLSSNYEGKYSLNIFWPEQDSLQPFKEHSLKWNSDGDVYDTLIITTEPEDTQCEVFFRNHLTDSGSVLYFSTLFSGEITVTAVRPNGKTDSYSRSLEMSNPFFIDGPVKGGVGDELEYALKRKDSGSVETVSQVIWNCGNREDQMNPDQMFRFTPSGTGSYNLVTKLVSQNGDRITLDTLSLEIPGHSPKIDTVHADDSVAQGKDAHISIYAQDSENDSVRAVLIRGTDTLRTDFFFYQEDNPLEINMPALSTDSVVKIYLQDYSGLYSETKEYSIHVKPNVPEVEFARDTVTFPINSDCEISIHSRNVAQYYWSNGTGSIDTTSDKPQLLLRASEETEMTLCVEGTDQFGNRSADSSVIRFQDLDYMLNFEEIPDSIPLRSWTSFRASLLHDDSNVNSDFVTFNWEIGHGDCEVKTETGLDSLSVYIMDSTSKVRIDVSAEFNNHQIEKISRYISVRPMLPECSITGYADTAEIQTEQTFTLAHEPGHISRPVEKIFYTVDESIADSVECTDENQTDFKVTFDQPGNYVINAWVRDTAGLLSPRTSIGVYAQTNRIWFETVEVAKNIFIHQTQVFTPSVKGKPLSEIREFIIDSDNDGMWDAISETEEIQIGPFSKPGTYIQRISAVSVDGDTAVKPVRITVNAEKGKPSARITDIATKAQDFFVNDSIFIHFSAYDTNGTVEKVYLEMNETLMDSVFFSSRNVSDSFHIHIPMDCSGDAVFRVQSADNDGYRSSYFKDSVHIRLGRPVLGPGNNYGNTDIQWKSGTDEALDTMFYVWNYNETEIAVDTADSNGRCVKYTWKWNKLGLIIDTTEVPHLAKEGLDVNDTNRVTVSAIDNDSVKSFPYSFFVVPDQPPPSPEMVNGNAGDLSEGVILRWEKQDARDGAGTHFRIEISYDGSEPSTVLQDFKPGYEYEQAGSEFRHTFFPESNDFRIKVTARDSRGSTAESVVARYLF